MAELPHAKRLLNEINARPAAQRVDALKAQFNFKTEMDAQARNKREDVKRHPLVQSILQVFPGAELEQVKQIGPVALPAAFATPAPLTGFGPRPDAEFGDDDYGDVDPEGDLDL